MGLFDGFRWLRTREMVEPVEKRQTLEDLLSRVAPTRLSPWRSASTTEAMGVPAVFRAVSLVANTTGVLSLEAFRQSVKLEAEETPQIVKRPDPFNTPQVFFRDTVDSMARLGEAWWWVAKRDGDGVAMSVLTVDPHEITVERNPKNSLHPIIRWLDREMPNEDMVQITLMRDPRNRLRGWGPLQACSAAVSVTVEAQEWAANFFGGNPTNTVIKAAYGIDSAEAGLIKEKWMEDAGNLPKIIDPGIESVTNVGVDPEKAQLTQVREFQNGEIALAFGIPGTLLEHFSPGASLTYQNVGQEFDKFIRSCLWPNYLEPIEQAMSDLLTRQTIVRFNTDGLLRPDPKSRSEIYNVLIPLGVMTPDEARVAEGFAPGSIEVRPVPLSPPAAIPSRLPVEIREVGGLREIHHDCGRLVGKVSGAAELWCRTCKETVYVEGDAVVIEERQQQPLQPMIAEGAIQVRVEMPAITVEAAPVPSINIEAAPAPNVTISEGAIQVPITIGQQNNDDQYREALFARLNEPQERQELNVNIPPVVVRPVEFPEPADLSPIIDTLALLAREQHELRSELQRLNTPRRRTVSRDESGRIVSISEVLESA